MMTINPNKAYQNPNGVPILVVAIPWHKTLGHWA